MTTKSMTAKTKEIKSLRALKSRGLPESAPPLEYETPGRKIARITKERDKAVTDLQELKRAFAERNLTAQRLRQSVSTSEITGFETRRKELAAKILDLNTSIGETNRAIREHRAERQGGRTNGSNHFAPPPPKPAVRSGRRDCPLRARSDWPDYFILAARNELTEALYSQIERCAKTMMEQALLTGISE